MSDEKIGIFIIVALAIIFGAVVYSNYLTNEMIVDLIKNGTPPAEARLAIRR